MPEIIHDKDKIIIPKNGHITVVDTSKKTFTTLHFFESINGNMKPSFNLFRFYNGCIDTLSVKISTINTK
jgi:hypothetical protein